MDEELYRGITPSDVERMAFENLRKANKRHKAPILTEDEIDCVSNVTAATRDAIFLLKDRTCMIISPKGDHRKYPSLAEAYFDYQIKGGTFFSRKS